MHRGITKVTPIHPHNVPYNALSWSNQPLYHQGTPLGGDTAPDYGTPLFGRVISHTVKKKYHVIVPPTGELNNGTGTGKINIGRGGSLLLRVPVCGAK